MKENLLRMPSCVWHEIRERLLQLPDVIGAELCRDKVIAYRLITPGQPFEFIQAPESLAECPVRFTFVKACRPPKTSAAARS